MHYFWAIFTIFILAFLKPDVRGTFGDMFGAVYALFSGLAFTGLIVTLIMQHEELGGHMYKSVLTIRK